MKGIVSEIQRFSIHDGPGIRTTVFMKGCPLRCRWCHNPETNVPSPQVRLTWMKCVHCGACAAVCPKGCHQMTENGHTFAGDACISCKKCIAICPTRALTLCGTEWDAKEVVNYAARDIPFYGNSGGITLSGGEPMLQGDFSIEILQRSKAAGIHTCVQTCGQFDSAFLQPMLTNTDYIMWDIKHTDPQEHRAVCGVGQDRILSNLRTASQQRKDILLRSVVAVGITDSMAHIEALASLAAELSLQSAPVLLAFHPFGASKADEIGWAREKMGDAYIPTAQSMQHLQAHLNACFEKEKGKKL